MSCVITTRRVYIEKYILRSKHLAQGCRDKDKDKG